MSVSVRSLHHRALLITRPEPYSTRLADSLRMLGARPLLAPMLRIAPPSNPAPLQQALADLARYRWVIAISPTAVDCLVENWEAVAAGRAWPVETGIAVMGRASLRQARALRAPKAIAPETGEDSTHLLAHPALQNLTGQQILLLQGEPLVEKKPLASAAAGHTVAEEADDAAGTPAPPSACPAASSRHLAEILRARGARLTEVFAYRRLPSSLNAAELAPLLRECEGIILHSRAAFDALRQLAEAADAAVPGGALAQRLRELPSFAPHPAIVTYLTQQGVRQSVLCAPGESGLIATLVDHYAHSAPQQAPWLPAAPLPAPTRIAADAPLPRHDAASAAVTAAHTPNWLKVGLTLVLLVILATFVYRQGMLPAALDEQLHWVAERFGGQAERTIAQTEMQRVRLDAQGEVLADLQRRLLRLQTQFDTLVGEQDGARLANSEMILLLARQQFDANGNAAQALKTLRWVERDLALEESSRFPAIRRALANDQALLRKLPVSDLQTMAAQLDTLAASVSTWPLRLEDRPDVLAAALLAGTPAATESKPKPASTAPPHLPASPSEAETWRTHLLRWAHIAYQDLIASLRAMVEIQRIDDAPLLDTTQRGLLFARCQLDLLHAKLSLLQHRPALFETLLQQIETTLRQQFDPQAGAVIAALQQLDTLRKNAAQRASLLEEQALLESLEAVRHARLTRGEAEGRRPANTTAPARSAP